MTITELIEQLKSPAFGSVVVTPTWYIECRISRIEIEN